MPDEMENEFMKRGYLLPSGCKDLIDVLKSNRQPTLFGGTDPCSKKIIFGEVTVPPQMTVNELAQALNQKPFIIIADLIKIGVLVNGSQQLNFDLISRIAQKYGFVAKRRA